MAAKSPSRRKTAAPPAAPAAPSAPSAADTQGSLLSTVSGPTVPPQEGDDDGLETERQRQAARSKAGAQRAAAAMPFNTLKRAEHGLDHGLQPQEGAHGDALQDDVSSASTLSEAVESDKLGAGTPRAGHNPLNGPLDRVRVDARHQALTTNQGVAVADNQHSLKAALRGPTLLEDFILREKITHFDHERIPERVVHARGSGAHGTFECYESLADLTRADLFASPGQRTPVFVRFSTVAGERGSADTARDVRGFAVKFYTEAGNWDLVGNNMPVFFIQDAMKFPDLVHAVKPEPHNGMPQAASAHDTFWDFVSLMPESTHMLLWLMSDRGIPRSYRTMQGFGVHSFRFVNAQGQARFVKFHWLPVAGTHSLVWDEAVRISGADPDFHRRDLWEAIESGNYPEFELAVQVFTEEQAAAFRFDVLDPTKLVPEELVPLRAVGRMVLDRNPDNFFAETEQVAFCTAHVVPGIDFSNDPLLQGRIHSYLDTQLTRLGGPNFHEIPINAPIAQVHNNQRDGLHRQAIHRGRVSYEPNSLGGGCPHQAGIAGFVSAREAAGMRQDGTGDTDDKVRGTPEKFADHMSQAQLFWRSQTVTEQRHVIAAFRFELSRVTVPAVRERVVSLLLNVDPQLARGVADGLGMALPAPMPMALETPVHSEVEASPGLSLFARPGSVRAAGRRVALLVADGVQTGPLRQAQRALAAAQAVPRFVGLRLGRVVGSTGAEGTGDAQGAPGAAGDRAEQTSAEQTIEVETTVEARPSVLWDAVVLPGGDAAVALLADHPEVVDFVKQQYRHGKPILLLGAGGERLLQTLGIPLLLDDQQQDPGLVLQGEAGADAPAPGQVPAGEDLLRSFVAAIGRHRLHGRETDPPRV